MRLIAVSKWSIACPTLVAALATGLGSAPVWALTLGHIRAESSIGQPLVAQLEITNLTPEQAASLEVQLADPDRLAAANITPHPALKGLRAQLITSTAPGSARIRLETSQPIDESFVDMALQFRWAGGQITRTYTLLLDPPSSTGLAITHTAPPLDRVKTPPSPPLSTPQLAPSAPPRITVEAGDTAQRIAQRFLQPGMTLDQVLLGLLSANPHAFIGNNVNLLKAGATLVAPTLEDIQSTPALQARQEVRAQTRDFIAYRQQLAQAAPQQASEPSAQQISGRVEDRMAIMTPPSVTQDRLELSKGQQPPSASAEATALNRQAQETQQRATELQRNLEDLEALSKQASNTASGATEATNTPGTVELAAGIPEGLTDAPSQSPADKARAAIEQLIHHPASGPAGLALIALLAVLGVFRVRRLRHAQRFKAMATRAAALASTASPVSPSSLATAIPPDTATDPLSEADVYWAYGMEAQAEALLLQALEQDPDSIRARMRLLDLYKTRGAVAAFNAMAQAVYDISLGQTREWEDVATMGRALDPSNPLYHPRVITSDHSALDLPADIKHLSLDLGSPDDSSGPRSST